MLATSLIVGQSRTKLERQKLQNLRKIQETEKIIKETKSRKSATMGQLTAISKQIEARQDLISNISREIYLLEEEIRETESVIEALEDDLERLKQEYASAIFAAYKMDNSYYKLAYILSAESFNQMVMRMKYFQQYSEARKRQVEQIGKVKEALGLKREGLNLKRDEKNSLLGIQTKETENLNELKQEKDQVIRELSKKEKELKKELEETKKSLQQLEKKIREVIAEERRKAIAEAEKRKKEEAERLAREGKAAKAAPAGSSSVSAFASNQNKLPWPVGNGTVVRKFGRQVHPVLKIEENNLGVGIQTLKGEKVKSVFKGKVVSITEIPGMNKIVMIQHDDYITVYARLKTVFVKSGQEVSAREAIGEVYTNNDEESMVEFQIWKGNSPLDPEAWLSRK